MKKSLDLDIGLNLNRDANSLLKQSKHLYPCYLNCKNGDNNISHLITLMTKLDHT